MSHRFVHTCIRVRDPEASQRFYGALGFEPRGRLNFATAYNLYLGLPGDGDVLELTVNRWPGSAATTSARATTTWRSRSRTSTRSSPIWSRSASPRRSRPTTRATGRNCR